LLGSKCLIIKIAAGFYIRRLLRIKGCKIVEQELTSFLENSGFSVVHVTRSLVLCVCFVDRCWSFCTVFLLTIVLSVLLRLTDSDYLFGIFKLFL
jgi:Ni,Fe-hydrogenase I cytochrome b subunit